MADTETLGPSTLGALRLLVNSRSRLHGRMYARDLDVCKAHGSSDAFRLLRIRELYFQSTLSSNVKAFKHRKEWSTEQYLLARSMRVHCLVESECFKSQDGSALASLRND